MIAAKKQKIIFLLPALTSGGAERVLITFMNNIDSARFAPHLLCVSDRGSIKSLLDPRVPFHSLQMQNVMLSIPKLYMKLRALKPDIIVSTMVHMNFALLLLSPFFPHTKFIVREAITPSFVFNQHKYIAPLLKIAYKLLYSRANIVLSPAQAIIDEFTNNLNMNCYNCRVLQNPVDIEYIRNFKIEPFKNDSDRLQKVHFIAAGRLHKQKGFDRLISALPNLDTPYDWQLTILGKGSECEALSKLIQETGLQERVKLAGHMQNPWPHYAQADCFLMPSRWEGLPNAVLESLACGTPAIVTAQSGGIAEIQKFTGDKHLRIVNNMQEFIKAMAKVKPNPSSAYRESLLPNNFYKTTIIKKFEEILDEVL